MQKGPFSTRGRGALAAVAVAQTKVMVKKGVPIARRAREYGGSHQSIYYLLAARRGVVAREGAQGARIEARAVQEPLHLPPGALRLASGYPVRSSFNFPCFRREARSRLTPVT